VQTGAAAEMSNKGGPAAWSAHHDAITEAAQAIMDDEVSRRAAKTARLREQRLSHNNERRKPIADDDNTAAKNASTDAR
jgi:hypothetical protein